MPAEYLNLLFSLMKKRSNNCQYNAYSILERYMVFYTLFIGGCANISNLRAFMQRGNRG